MGTRAANDRCRENHRCRSEKSSNTGEGPLPRIQRLPMAGLEKKYYQLVFVLNLEKMGLVEGS